MQYMWPITKLPILKCVKNIRSFSEHVRFYRRFIKDFRKIVGLLTNLLVKDMPFFFDDEGLNTWEMFKMEFISAPIISVPDWPKPFEIICDASDFIIGIVLG